MRASATVASDFHCTTVLLRHLSILTRCITSAFEDERSYYTIFRRLNLKDIASGHKLNDKLERKALLSWLLLLPVNDRS